MVWGGCPPHAGMRDSRVRFLERRTLLKRGIGQKRGGCGAIDRPVVNGRPTSPPAAGKARERAWGERRFIRSLQDRRVEMGRHEPAVETAGWPRAGLRP